MKNLSKSIKILESLIVKFLLCFLLVISPFSYNCQIEYLSETDQATAIKAAAKDFGSLVRESRKLQMMKQEDFTKEQLTELDGLKDKFNTCFMKIADFDKCVNRLKNKLISKKGDTSFGSFISLVGSVIFVFHVYLFNSMNTNSYSPVNYGPIGQGLLVAGILGVGSYPFFNKWLKNCDQKNIKEDFLNKLFGSKENRKLFFQELRPVLDVPENRQILFFEAALNHNLILPEQALGSKKELKDFIGKYIAELEKIKEIYARDSSTKAYTAAIEQEVIKLKKARKFKLESGAVKAIGVFTKVHSAINNIAAESYRVLGFKPEASMDNLLARVLSPEELEVVRNSNKSTVHINKYINAEDPELEKILDSSDDLNIDLLARWARDSNSQIVATLEDVSSGEVARVKAMKLILSITPSEDDNVIRFEIPFAVMAKDYAQINNNSEALDVVRQSISAGLENSLPGFFRSLDPQATTSIAYIELLNELSDLLGMCDKKSPRSADMEGLDAILNSAGKKKGGTSHSPEDRIRE